MKARQISECLTVSSLKSKEKGHLTYFKIFIPLIIFGTLLTWSSIKQEIMSNLFARSSYYVLLLLFLLWVYHIREFLKNKQFSIRNFFLENAGGMICSLLLAAVIFITVPPDFRTLSDETNLLSVSKSMVHQKTVYNVTMGKYYREYLMPIEKVIPKRPLIFPFFINIVHTITGTRPENGFVLNFLFLLAMIFMIYKITRYFSSTYTSIAAVFLVFSFPLLTIFATSSGFDFCNAFFFFLSFVILYDFLQEPTPEKFGLLWITTIIFANIRYESAVIFIIIFGASILLKYVKVEFIKENIFSIFCTPLLFLPLIWQRILARWEYENPTGVALFAFEHFKRHFLTLIKSCLSFDFEMPYSPVIFLLALISLMYIIFYQFRNNFFSHKKHIKHFFIIFSFSVLVSTAIFLFHFNGDASHPAMARFFIIFSIVLGLLPILAKILYPNVISSRFLLVSSILFFSYYHPVATSGKFINRLDLIWETKFFFKYAEKMGGREILSISFRPGQFVAKGFQAVNFAYANKNASQLLKEWRMKKHTKIIVFQRINVHSGDAMPKHVLNKRFRLRTIREIPISSKIFTRISEVENIEKQLSPFG